MATKRRKRRPKLRLIQGGAVVKVPLPKPEAGTEPSARFCKVLYSFIGRYMKAQQEWPKDYQITDHDVVAVLMGVTSGMALAHGIPADQFLDGMATVIEQELDKIEKGPPAEPPTTPAG